MLKGILVVGPRVILKLQGPKGNEAKVFLLVTNGLIVMLGGMEDEVFDPSGSIPVVNGLDVFGDGRGNVVLRGGKGVYCEMWIGVVKENADGILVVGWDVVCTKG